jgi:hypothetical protein
MDKLNASQIMGQAIGVFAYMVVEALLGKSKFGSFLGLAWAIFRAIIKALWASLTWGFKPAPTKEKEETHEHGT